ncbi:MAG TPA: fumarylacetoacetate hydrolase family protein [Caulobacteraceae bacterium]|jgi:2-keto-4-pentenoate hydratase/2-oxohepta-3-ene-1,7-dioic acid hydratase in catechol pathway
MKLVTFDTGDGPELGAVVGDGVAPLSRLAPGLAADMIDAIARWERVGPEMRRLVDEAHQTLPLAGVRLLAPVPRPGKIMAIGLNYADHIAESGQQTPEHQTWFSKAVGGANGPFAPVEVPKVSRAIDYEAELVAIVGAGGRHISREAAPAAVFGYCCGNDVSVRDWQSRTTQWVLGKSFDTHAPFGPWITTADEVTDPHTLGIRCYVNGEKRQDSNTKHLVFDVWAQLELLSQAMRLEPGDVIFTGTPAGVGAAMNPRQFLKAGDKVRVEIDQLGAIENTMENEA